MTKRKLSWGEMRSPEVRDAQKNGAVVLVPVGSIEQHGAHLPVDVDVHIPTELAMRVAAEIENVVVAPPLCYGFTIYQAGMPGTITLRSDTLHALLMDVCNSLIDNGFTRIILLVGHASNRPVAQLAIAEIAAERKVKVVLVCPSDLFRGEFSKIRKSEVCCEAHAGEAETAIEMALRPALVEQRLASKTMIDAKKDLGLSYAGLDFTRPGMASLPWDFKSILNGTFGDPTVATVETGRQLVRVMEEHLKGIVREVLQADFVLRHS